MEGQPEKADDPLGFIGIVMRGLDPEHAFRLTVPDQGFGSPRLGEGRTKMVQ